MNTPGPREAEDIIQQQTTTPENKTQGLEEQMRSSYEATQRCPQRHASPTSKYQFFERHERQYNKHVVLYNNTCCIGVCMVLEREPAAKLHAKNIEVELAQIIDLVPAYKVELTLYNTLSPATRRRRHNDMKH